MRIAIPPLDPFLIFSNSSKTTARNEGADQEIADAFIESVDSLPAQPVVVSQAELPDVDFQIGFEIVEPKSEEQHTS